MGLPDFADGCQAAEKTFFVASKRLFLFFIFYEINSNHY